MFFRKISDGRNIVEMFYSQCELFLISILKDNLIILGFATIFKHFSLIYLNRFNLYYYF